MVRLRSPERCALKREIRLDSSEIRVEMGDGLIPEIISSALCSSWG